MGRLLFLLVIFIVIYWLFKVYRRQVPKDEYPKNISGQPEDMVRCVHCGVHLPKHESILAGSEYYCSEAHRRVRTDKLD